MVKINVIDKSDKELLLNEDYRTQLLGEEVSNLYADYLKLYSKTQIPSDKLQILRQLIMFPETQVITGIGGTSVRVDTWVNSVDKKTGEARAFLINSEIPVLEISLLGFISSSTDEAKLKAMFRVYVFLLFMKTQPKVKSIIYRNVPAITFPKSETPLMSPEQAKLGNHIFQTPLGKNIFLVLMGIFYGDAQFLRKQQIKKEIEIKNNIFDFRFTNDIKNQKQLNALYASYPSISAGKKAIKEQITYLDAVLTNSCPHIELLKEYRNSVLKTERIEAFKKLKEFFDNKKQVEHQIKCKACKMRIMCGHVQIAEDFQEDFALLEQHMIPFQETKTEDMVFFCKFCGEKLYESQYSQDFDEIQTGSTYTFSTTDKIMYRGIMRVFDLVKLDPKLNRRNLINTLLDLMRPVIAKSQESLEKTKRTEEEIDMYLVAQSMVFAATYMIYLAEKFKKGIIFPGKLVKTTNRIQELGGEIVKQFRTEYINPTVIKNMFTASYSFIYRIKTTPSDFLETTEDFINYIKNSALTPFFVSTQVICWAPYPPYDKTDDLAIKRGKITTKKLLELLEIKDPEKSQELPIFDFKRFKKPKWDCLKNTERTRLLKLIWSRIFDFQMNSKASNKDDKDDKDTEDNEVNKNNKEEKEQFPPDEKINELTNFLYWNYLKTNYLPYMFPFLGTPQKPLEKMDVRWFYDSSGKPYEKPWLGDWNKLKKESPEKIEKAHQEWKLIQEFKLFYEEVCPVAIRHDYDKNNTCKYCGKKEKMTEKDWLNYIKKYREKYNRFRKLTGIQRGEPQKFTKQKDFSLSSKAISAFTEDIKGAPTNAFFLLAQLTDMENFPDPKIIEKITDKYDFRIPLMDSNIKLTYQYYNLCRFVGSENLEIKEIYEEAKLPAPKIIKVQKLGDLDKSYNKENENRFYTMEPANYFEWQKSILSNLLLEIEQKDNDVNVKKLLVLLTKKIKEKIWKNSLAQMKPEMLKVGIDFVYKFDLEPIDDEELEEKEDEDFDFDPDQIDEDDSFEMDDQTDE